MILGTGGETGGERERVKSQDRHQNMGNMLQKHERIDRKLGCPQVPHS